MNSFKLLLSSILISVSFLSFAQPAACFNADFEDNSFTNWTGFYGSCCGINTPNQGFTNQHQIMVGPGTDPMVAACATLSIVPPGENFSAMVGDLTGTGAQA